MDGAAHGSFSQTALMIAHSASVSSMTCFGMPKRLTTFIGLYICRGVNKILYRCKYGKKNFRANWCPPHESRGTPNIEHPTPNIEWQRESSLPSAFEVRCWTFDVILGSGVSTRECSLRGNLSPEQRGRSLARSATACPATAG